MRAGLVAAVVCLACCGAPRGEAVRASTGGSAPAPAARRGTATAARTRTTAAARPARAPATCAWRPAAPLPVGRRREAAVVLVDGRVLVVGGTDDGTRCDLYDPASDTWHETGRLSEPRWETKLVTLPDGRVLAVGGETRPVNGWGRTARTAEIYDPASGRWAAAGELREPRSGHTATLLADGSVLVAAGCGSVGQLGGELLSTELFDVATGTWRDGPRLAQARVLHTATLLADGRVVVIGGQRWSRQTADAVAEVEVLDAGHARWSLATPIPEPRSGHTATVLRDGRLLLVGGWNRDHGRTLLVDLYDAAHDRWAEGGELVTGRDSHSATRLPDGRVVVIGGQSNASLLRGLRENAVEVYDPAVDTWSRPASTPSPRMEQSTVLLADGELLVFGGVDSTYDPPLLPVERGRCP